MTPAALPAAMRCGRVALRVANLDRSVAFCRQVLGLAVPARDSGYATLAAPGGAEPLLLLETAPGTLPAGRLAARATRSIDRLGLVPRADGTASFRVGRGIDFVGWKTPKDRWRKWVDGHAP